MKRKNLISSAIFLTGICFVLYGVLIKKENLVVLNKAIRICMECIGIG
ncbi:CD1871A family CXXC motif-containing protein [Eubacteriales bacterium KG127]